MTPLTMSSFVVALP